MTTEPKAVDLEGYILLPKEYTKLGFKYRQIKELPGNWFIYEQSKNGAIHYELIHSKKGEAYEIAGVKFEKRWQYCSSSQWGICGWTFKTLEAAEKKYLKLTSNNNT